MKPRVHVVAVALVREAESGTIMVKRYRLVR